MTFEEFYKKFGFEKYPFSTFTAENELEKLNEIFVHPTCYSPIKESIDSGATAFIYGERGTGKTALLKETIKSKKAIEIDNFASIPIDSSNEKFYDLLISNISKNRRPQKLSATPDLSGTVLPLCPITNSVSQSALPSKLVFPRVSASGELPG